MIRRVSPSLQFRGVITFSEMSSLLATRLCRLSVRYLACIYCFLFSLTTICIALRIQVTAPVNPVRVAGVVSIHCQIWDLPPGYEVALSRKTGDNLERLAWNRDLQTTVPERVFLAVRTLEDGSTVYFLTIMEVVTDDKGTYNCTILSDTYKNVAEDSVRINVQYFPKESDPVCTPNSIEPIVEGSEIILNCSSEAANPVVSLEWSQTVGSTISSDTRYRSGIVYNELRIRPTIADDGFIFICNIKSSAFPLTKSSCHVGQIKVIPNPRKPFHPVGSTDVKTTVVDSPILQTDSVNVKSVTWGKFNTKKNTTSDMTETCKNACSMTDKNVLFWIICTVVAASCACVFLIIGIALVLKTQQLSMYQYPDVQIKDDQHHQVYVELQKRQQIQRQTRNDLYMDLTKVDVENNCDSRLMYIRKPSDQMYSETLDVNQESRRT